MVKKLMGMCLLVFGLSFGLSGNARAETLVDVIENLGLDPFGQAWTLRLRPVSGMSQLDRKQRFTEAGYENLEYHAQATVGGEQAQHSFDGVRLGPVIPLFLQKKIADHFIESCAAFHQKGAYCAPFFQIQRGLQVTYGVEAEDLFLKHKRENLLAWQLWENGEFGQRHWENVEVRRSQPLGAATNPSLNLAIAHAFNIWPEKLLLRCLVPGSQLTQAELDSVSFADKRIVKAAFPSLGGKTMVLGALARLEQDQAFQVLLIDMLTKKQLQPAPAAPVGYDYQAFSNACSRISKVIWGE